MDLLIVGIFFLELCKVNLEAVCGLCSFLSEVSDHARVETLLQTLLLIEHVVVEVFVELGESFHVDLAGT